MSKFFCDTNCEINLEKFKSLGISLIKMPYTINGIEYYYDLGENTDLEDFFNQMKKGASVKTQALNTFDYIEYFTPVLESGEDIIYVTFSHRMSGTFESLKRAIQDLKEKFPGRTITIVDTKGISQGAGVIVEMAANLHNQGKSDQEVKAEVEKFRDRVHTYFTVENLEYLRRGGRLSKFKSFMGTLLNMKPIISVMDGVLVNTENAKGRKSALKRMADIIAKDNIDTSQEIVLMHAQSRQDSDLLQELVLEKVPMAKINVQDIGPVIGCHCGPGTVGIVYINKEN